MTDQSEVYLPALVARLVQRAERVLQGVDVLIAVARDLPEHPVSLASKRHLTMFFKEAIHNCARHSGADRVEIQVDIRENFLEIEIKDNGCGFDQEGPTSGWGLSNMLKRAEELSGLASIESEVGNGTSVRLRIPVEVLEKDPKSPYWTSN